MVRFDRNCRVAFASLLATAAAVSAGEAQADSRATLDVSLGARAASNPFLSTNGDTSDYAASLDVAPAFRVEDEVSSLVLDGLFHADHYFDRYDDEYSGRAGLAASKKLSEATSVSAKAGFSTSRSSVQDVLFARPGELLDPNAVPDVPLPDVTVAGRRSRSYAYTAALGLKHAMSPVDSIEINADAGLYKYNSTSDADYRMGSVGVQYAHTLSERTALTASVQLGAADYIDRRTGDGYFITPMLGVQQQLSETWSLTAGAGASFSATRASDGSRHHSTGLAGSASLCNRRENSGFCASVARQTRPTARGGVSSVTSAAVTYDQVLSLRDRVSFSARYARNRQTTDLLLPLPDEKTEVLGASASLQHTFSDRLSGFVTPSYTKVYEDTTKRKANYQLTLGVTYRFGKLR